MGKFRESQTAKNLLTSFAGESQARNRYTYFARRAAEEGMAQGGGAGGVGDAHLAEADDVEAVLHRQHAVGHGVGAFGVAHGGALGEIGGRFLQPHLIDLKFRVEGLAELVDRRAAGAEVGHHLHRDLCREGRYALRRDTMIAGKHAHPRMVDPRRMAALPQAHPAGNFLESAQRSGGFGQLRLVRLGRGAGGKIGSRQIVQQPVDFIETRRFRSSSRSGFVGSVGHHQTHGWRRA